MKLTVKGIEYEFSEDSLTNREAMDIEKVTGGSFGQFTEALKDGSTLALTAMVWTVQKRDNPSLRFGDVEFTFGELEVVNDEPEADAPAVPSAPV